MKIALIGTKREQNEMVSWQDAIRSRLKYTMVHIFNANRNNWEYSTFVKISNDWNRSTTRAEFEACIVLHTLSDRARDKTLAQALRRKYIGKYIILIFEHNQKACWQKDNVYCKAGSSRREMMFVFSQNL